MEHETTEEGTLEGSLSPPAQSAGRQSPPALTRSTEQELEEAGPSLNAAAPRRRGLRKPTPQHVLEVVFALARETSLDRDREELCGRFLRAITELFPGRSVCLRLIDPGSLALSELFAEGELRPDAAELPLGLKPSALTKTRLTPRVSTSPRVRLCDAYEPIFHGTEAGLSIPLVASGKLFGVLNVEYPAGCAIPAGDEPVLISLANQLASAVRNGHLLEQTRHLRDYLARVVEHANALIFATDATGRATIFNQALARLTGFSAQEVLGQDLRAWFTRHGAEELARLVDSAMRGEERAAIEVAMPVARGAMVRASFSTTALTDLTDQVETVVAIGQDQTALVALQKQVIQAEKLATLGQLAAGVVHELNNPLTSIIVYADYLAKKLGREGGDPQDVVKLHKILEGSERILRVSRDLVAYARPAGEQYDLLSVNEVVEQSLSFCEHVLKKSKAKAARELAPQLPPVYGIRAQLQQVLINLFTNASHAMKDVGGTITVRTGDGGGGCVVVEIEDDGIGISESDQPRIYEPFYTTKTDGKGTGLGLSIVKNIIEKHQGDIQFHSSPGAGTTFRIVLPCGQRPAR
ncbi:MAG TPA: ATP-binding protein [Polyangia bacterium]